MICLKALWANNHIFNHLLGVWTQELKLKRGISIRENKKSFTRTLMAIMNNNSNKTHKLSFKTKSYYNKSKLLNIPHIRLDNKNWLKIWIWNKPHHICCNFSASMTTKIVAFIPITIKIITNLKIITSSCWIFKISIF